MPEKYDIFISYSSKDEKIVFEILEVLERKGLSCWIAPRDIPAGTDYASAIMNGIKKCDTFIVIITDSSNNSEDVRNEVNNAHNLKKKIIPIKFYDIELSEELKYYLSRKQWLTVEINNIDAIPIPGPVPDPDPDPVPKPLSERLLHIFKRIIRSKVAIFVSVFSLIIISIIIAFCCYKSQYEDSCLALMDAIIQDVDTLKYEPSNTKIVNMSECELLDAAEYKLLTEVNSNYYNNASVQEIHDKAKKGDAFAQFCLYHIYIEGDGVPKDTATAEKWLKKSASQFYPLALYKSYYSSHPLFDDDMHENMRRFLKSLVDNGSISHQGYYGYCLYNCGSSYYSEAVHWLTKAAKNGDAKAMNNLGCMAYNGHGMNENRSMAIEWFKKAAEEDNPEAQYNLGNICFTNKEFTEAIDWYTQAANNKCSSAFLNLAFMYDKGIGVEPNTDYAIKLLENERDICYLDEDDNIYLGVLYYKKGYFSKAEDLFSRDSGGYEDYGNPVSNYNLGIMYEDGNGDTQDLSMAVSRFEKAQRKDCPDAYLKLIKFYVHGIGTEKEYDNAFKLCRESALKGDVKAQTILGFMYSNGWGCKSNTHEGLRWTKTAAQKKYPAALYSLGLCYKYGIGVHKDEKLSQKHHKEAKSLGFKLD